MASEFASRRQVVILALLLVALAGVIGYRMRSGEPAASAPAASNRQRGRPAAHAGAPTNGEELDVRIETLADAKPEPGAVERNPFRFRPKPPAPMPQAPIQPPPPPVPVDTGPPSPPAPPPIGLKFIGVIESPTAGRIAALTDGRLVHHGKEGDIIVGQYRIVRIGVESIVMEHVDGRGRQTIRLTGQ